jgi:Flp pilus assembly pilin Flp
MCALVTLWDDEGQDIAEYTVMLAVILVIVIGTIRMVGPNRLSVGEADRNGGAARYRCA